MGDKMDPLDGWPIWEVHHRQSHAKEDCYGKLFAYLMDTFKAFLERLDTIGIGIEMYRVDAKELPKYLERDKFARIEVRR